MAPLLRRISPILLLTVVGCGIFGDDRPDAEEPGATDSAAVASADSLVDSLPPTDPGSSSPETVAQGQEADAPPSAEPPPGTVPGVEVVDTLAYLLGRLDSLVAGQQSLIRRLDSLAVDPSAAATPEGIVQPAEVLGQAGESVQSFTVAAVLSVVVIILFNLLVRGAVWLLDALAERQPRRRLFYKRLVPVTRIVLWIFAAYLIVRVIFRIDAQGIFAAAAAIGVAVGFAAQDLLKNLFGGLILVFDQPFQVGDKIRVGETYGEVVSIGLRSTRIVTADDNRVSVPNAQVVDQQVANANTGELNCQVVTDLYLPGWADEETAKRIAFQAAASSKYVYLNKPIVVLVSDVFKETFLTRVRVKAYVLDPRFEFLFQSDITERARAGFREAGLLRPEHMRTDLVEQAMARASGSRGGDGNGSESSVATEQDVVGAGGAPRPTPPRPPEQEGEPE